MTVRVACSGVSKRFLHFEDRATSIKEVLLRKVLRRPYDAGRPVFHLRDFDLEVRAGEAITIVGANGSGKSTALRLLAGVYRPTEGNIVIDGRLTAIIELGIGFHPELSGRENVRLYSAVCGLSPRQLEERYESIVEFSGVREYMDQPLKYYSTGMQARLAFAVMVATRPDIMLVDEVLAVGDFGFREKCIDFFGSFLEGGGTLIAVSHDIGLVRALCQRAVWLDKGRVRMDDDVEVVASAYVRELGLDPSVLD
jgi:ABC-type polysaccharide/polyol phosphate transport system ATPase subunit